MLDSQKQMWLLTLSMVASLDVKLSHISRKFKTLMNLSTDNSILLFVDLDSIIARHWMNGMLINFPMCTIASMPRLPEHCVEYVRMLQWPKDKPFGDGVGLDGDNPEHIHWVFQRAQERAVDYSITGVTYRLTQGVVKRIIPAVASTNAVIAAACSTEVFKIASRRIAQLVARCPRIYSSHPLPSYRRSWST
ncbi:NEDD8-activating enzyme E1 catalytic subunit-like [Oncorhynchus kisutch]|uniref:NEDD8-activating enzyme E1 catalytic subunit-like n=1 Tax=Oncorhynchus kisutch TaxID=8019 RepID=UPI0012DDF641|nr:NEDD8-activating enzyme E1 catalytic subunit-like [Oncorhynchus kisutch]XP_031650254.1 NEDD8-activating enzyme E1 catalytic subunit-like [Oncorhynchus kisutch]XP_031650255.1 NEDD8-activating enzyme E1 catalytic subunit-like [Oncorhynchus kisutch]